MVLGVKHFASKTTINWVPGILTDFISLSPTSCFSGLTMNHHFIFSQFSFRLLLPFCCSLLRLQLSLMVRIVPSPDWFVGVDSVDLCDGDHWKEKVTLELFPYDAGTDSGFTFSSPNFETIPQDRVTQVSWDHQSKLRTGSSSTSLKSTHEEYVNLSTKSSSAEKTEPDVCSLFYKWANWTIRLISWGWKTR